MATKHGDPGFEAMEEKLEQEPINEEDIDELRQRGQGFAREGAREGRPGEAQEDDRAEPGAAAVQPGRMLAGSGENLGGHGLEVGAEEEEESVLERRRAEGRAYTDPEPTQLEEDFGERGLTTPGGPFDSEHKPSILDPHENEE